MIKADNPYRIDTYYYWEYEARLILQNGIAVADSTSRDGKYFIECKENALLFRAKQIAENSHYGKLVR